jgi:hypothetical protein
MEDERFKLDGSVRLDYTKNYGDINNNRSRLRLRLYPDYNIDGNWHAKGMLEAEKVAMEDYANIPLIDRGGSALKAEYVKGLIDKPVGVAYTFTYVDLN